MYPTIGSARALPFLSMARPGSTMVYVILIMIAVTALGAGIVSMTTTSHVNELSAKFLTQAKYAALSGVNYAAAFNDESETNDILTLSGETYGLATNIQYSIRVPADPPVNGKRVVTSTGLVNAGAATETQYTITKKMYIPGGKVSFDDHFSGFSSPSPGTPENGETYIHDTTRKEIGFKAPDTDLTADPGSQYRLCVWYQGHPDDDFCDNLGRCPMLRGARVYFKFWNKIPVDYSGTIQQLYGWTFALMGSAGDNETWTQSAANLCGDPENGNGYAGCNEADQCTTNRLVYAPKLGMEFDFISPPAPAFNNDPADNHVGWLYWAFYTPPTLYDDTYHDHGGDTGNDIWNPNDTLDDPNPGNLGLTTAYTDPVDITNPLTTAWLQNGEADGLGNPLSGWHTCRMDIYWREYNGEITVKAWVDPPETAGYPDPADLDVPYDDSTVCATGPGLCTGSCYKIADYSRVLPKELRDEMEAVRFGWTMGSKAGGEVRFKDLAIQFVKNNFE